MTRTGNARRRCTERDRLSIEPPRRKLGVKKFAATATGDIACAASPIHANPGSAHVRNRSFRNHEQLDAVPAITARAFARDG